MTIWLWIGFIAIVLALLALDLGVFHRDSKEMRVRDALGWTAFWMGLALAFNVAVYFIYEQHWLGMGTLPGQEPHGREAAEKFFVGYLVEQSLSLDNIFVMAVIFRYFGVAGRHQHRVLFWGIIGAQIMRGIMIAAGTIMIRRFDWMIYVFGGLLLLTALKMLVQKEGQIEPEHNPLVKLARKFWTISPTFDGHRFFTRVNGRRMATPMLLVLLVVESTDVIFAVDSIPATFAITQDPFIVFTSNIFAILGLRSLYFALAGLMGMFHYLKYSLVFVLAFVGVKMLLSHHYEIPTRWSLVVIAAALAIGTISSVLITRKETIRAIEEDGDKTA